MIVLFSKETECFSDTIPELAHLLLVVVSRQRTSRTQSDRHRRASAGLHDARYRRAHQHDAVAKRKFSAVILVLLDTVALDRRLAEAPTSSCIRSMQPETRPMG